MLFCYPLARETLYSFVFSKCLFCLDISISKLFKLTFVVRYPLVSPTIGNFSFTLAPLGNPLIARPHPWNSPDQPLFAAHQYIYSPPFGYALPPPVSAVVHPIVYSHLLAFRLDGSLEQARY